MGIGRCALRVDLKWPNDVLLSGKKVAGILIEAADRPGGSGTAAVIGVGVNVGIDSVPDGMEGSATSVSCEAGDAVPRRVLIVTFLRCFQQEYESFERGEHRAILERWRSFSSMWDGTRIWLSEGDTCREATTCGLSDHGALHVRLSDGTEETVLAADVSVRYDSTDHPKLEHE